MINNINKDEVLNFLLSEPTEENSRNKYVILFDSTRQLKNFSENIGKELHESIILHKSNPFRVSNNMIIVGDKTVLLGLKINDQLLLNHYSEEEVRYYNGEGTT